jgi:hypothetical protein
MPRANPRAFTPVHWIVISVIAAIWWGIASFFAAIFVTDYPQYAPAGYGAAFATGVILGLIHLGWLAIFRGKSALWGLVIAKLAAIPITIGFSFFALAMGAMGADAGVEKAAEQIHVLIPFCMIIASLPTTLAALLGAGIGWGVGRRKAANQAALDESGRYKI